MKEPAQSYRVYVVAGEQSGDVHGAGVIKELLAAALAIEFAGVGGSSIKELGGEGIRDWLEDSAVMGIWEVLKKYGWFKEQMKQMLEEVEQFQPHAVLLIDYPGFNLRFAKALRAAMPGIRIIGYISPQVWAWKENRVPKIAACFDLMICLFPFEREIFEKAGLKTVCSGHPILDELNSPQPLSAGEIDRDLKKIGFFPGSREHELARLLPVFFETIHKLEKAYPLKGFQYIISAASPSCLLQIEEEFKRQESDTGGTLTDLTDLGERIFVDDSDTGDARELMRKCGLGVVASGTASLEATVLGMPFCLVYKVNPLTYAFAKLVVKIPHVGLANILSGRGIVPELIQGRANPLGIFRELSKLIDSEKQRVAMQKDLAEVKDSIGEAGSYARAANAILDCMGVG